MIVSTSVTANSLKRTLQKVINDAFDQAKKNLMMPKYLDEEKMEDNFIDFLEMGGPGLASEKSEGSEIALGTIREGVLARFFSRTFALRLAITEEAMEDQKYDQVIAATERLGQAMWSTVDYDAANILIRATNASFLGADGVALGSNAHTLPAGGTWSNLMATPMSPSRMAIQLAITQIRKFPRHDGLFGNYKPECVVSPVDQEFAWKGILGSSYAPEPGAFNEINVVNREYDLDLYPIVYWSTTTTNWAVKTSAPDGLKWFWRVKPSGRSWMNNDSTVMFYGSRARWARGWIDPRAVLFVNA